LLCCYLHLLRLIAAPSHGELLLPVQLLSIKLKCPFSSYGYCFLSFGYPLWAAASSRLVSMSHELLLFLIWLPSMVGCSLSFYCLLGFLLPQIYEIGCGPCLAAFCWCLFAAFPADVCCPLVGCPLWSSAASIPYFTCHLCLPHTCHQFVCSIPAPGWVVNEGTWMSWLSKQE
jgi:hypothetical protein